MRDVNENELQVHGVEVEDERNVLDMPEIHDAPRNENIQTTIDEPIIIPTNNIISSIAEGHLFPRYDKVPSYVA